ncbi:MAG TPA: C39 family peptidase [Allosphingosinicella sp.]
MGGLLRFSALIGLSLLTVGCAAELKSDPAFAGGTSPIGDFRIPVRSLEERRYETVVRQKYDFSCGSAAVATLLKYHYGDRHDEETAFRGMWAEGDRAQIRRLGFSLLDMKLYMSKLGFRADGFKVSLEDIAKAGVPGIALLNIKGYKHFVVVKGVSKEEVLVGDPALGLRTMKRDDFKTAWNGVYFAVNSHTDRGRANFNGDVQWASFSRAPVGAGFTDPLSQQALALTAPFITDY